MVFLKTEDEIDLMRAANRLVSQTLTEVGRLIKPGVTTKQLDKVAEEFIRDHGAIPTFLGFPNPYGGDFPASLCTSVNDEVVHGIPTDEPLKEGDIVSVDCGALLNGFNGDSCYTFRVGEVSEEVNRLLRTTKESLYKGIEAAYAGKRIGDIGHAVQRHCEEQGFGVIREFVGHGIGKDMHEDPQVPNYGQPGTKTVLKPGMTIAIEPMVNVGTFEVKCLSDGWTVKTVDGSLSSHYENTVLITKDEPVILTADKDGKHC